MKVCDFDFDLPEERIALRPASPKDSAKLLQVSRAGELLDYCVKDLPGLLLRGDVLVINETRVLHAALNGTRKARDYGGGGDVNLNINLHTLVSKNEWRAFIRPAKRLKVDDIVYFSDDFHAVVYDKLQNGDIGLRFNMSGIALTKAIDKFGKPPIPPYISRKRPVDDSDVNDYQTIYASENSGSVAAPTAGLHFTDTLFKELNLRGIQIERLTLHVSAGTFLPVKTEDTKDHHMHTEWYEIPPDTAKRINSAKSEGRRIVAVGTTTLRALESSARKGIVTKLADQTNIFITPGFKFEIIDGLMTNFHLPRSTLFMLVSALSGLKNMKFAYLYAIKNKYRFYSYGDTSLLWKSETLK
ncbi:MAG: tRNA preQ1(34) S-adenosylmethionine ribosyltransferase-isomerase QueA [Hellea sp.]|nr:tRNA preQ1(34) S-adenosylmethionine ribosyltransferase-isomerase QueA [Hellea sp.]